MADRNVYDEHEVDVFLGDEAEEYDYWGIMDEATFEDDGIRYWRPNVDLAEVCERHRVDGESKQWYAVDQIFLGNAQWSEREDMTMYRLMAGSLERCMKVAATESILVGGSDAPFIRVSKISDEMGRAVRYTESADSRMLTLSEAAEMAGISKQGMHDRIKRGRMPAERVGGAWRIPAVAVLDFKARR